MRRFSFKLDKLLELRRYSERELEIKLAEAASRVIAVDREIAEWHDRRRTEASFGISGGTVDVSLLNARDDFLTLVDDRVRKLERRRRHLENERTTVADAYLEASRKRKVLSKLKERREREYYDAAKREEMKEIDEIGANLFGARFGRPEGEDV